MAKLPSLVSALTEVDGRERKTIDHIARTIREAGHMPTGKRGVGAAEMDARAAVNLLLALNGTDIPKDAPVTVERFRSLVPFDPVNELPDPPTVLVGMETAIDFGSALEMLIEGVPELVLSFAQALASAHDSNIAGIYLRGALNNNEFLGIEVTLQSRGASIELWRYTDRGREIDWRMQFVADVDQLERGLYGTDISDRRRSVGFGIRTLVAVWQCLHVDDALDAAGLVEGE